MPSRTIHLHTLAGLVAVFSVACTAGGSGARSAEAKSPLIGAKAPSFDLPAQAGGKRASLESVDGKVGIIDFWATWCEPCQKSFPKYQALVAKYESDLGIIGISEDDEPDSIRDFAKETGVEFVLAWDRDKRVAERYKPEAMPTGFIVDKQGVVRYMHAGYHEGEEAQIEKQVQALLAE